MISSSTSGTASGSFATGGRYVVKSEINHRDDNEDSFLITELTPVLAGPVLPVLAIADGMGGLEHGGDVSREALRRTVLALLESIQIEPRLNRSDTAEPMTVEVLQKALWGALEQANAQVRRMVQANGWHTAGSTIVVALLVGETVVAANLGDSPLFHYDATGQKLVKITRDHSVAGVLLRAGMISPEMARHHEGRSRLEFFVGAPSLPREISVYNRPLHQGDLLLLCTDGVSGSLSHERLTELLATAGGDLERTADALIKAGRDLGEKDNQTLILWWHGSEQTERQSADAGETSTVAQMVGAVEQPDRSPTVSGGDTGDGMAV